MAKLTVLEMTQKILSSMDSDDVNSISGSEEALQVVDIIEDTYKKQQIGIACDFEDIEGMSNAIIELLNDNKKREEFGKNARDFAKKDWYYPNIVNKLAELYIKYHKADN